MEGKGRTIVPRKALIRKGSWPPQAPVERLAETMNTNQSEDNRAMNTLELKQPVRQVIQLLVEQRYSELESLTKGIRLGARDIAGAIADYKGTLVMPPEDSYDLMNVVSVRNAKPPKWSIIMLLWTKEEGRSDLSIELTLVKETQGFRIELDDIHVL